MQTVRVDQLAQLLRDTILESEMRERERIVRLLEDKKVSCNCGDTCGYFDAGYHEAIALIKGENK